MWNYGNKTRLLIARSLLYEGTHTKSLHDRHEIGISFGSHEYEATEYYANFTSVSQKSLHEAVIWHPNVIP